MNDKEALKLALEALMRSRKAVSGDLDLAGCAYGRNDPEGHRYNDAKKALVTLDKAITALREALAQPQQEPRDIAALVQGMEVSIDVSTGEHDQGHRLFGTVTLVQESQKGKHGLILLVQDPQPNFKAQPKQEPVAHLWECIGRWSAYLVNNGKQADCAPPSWLVDAVNNATTPPKRKPWVDLTDEEIQAVAKQARSKDHAVTLTVRLLKEKQT